MGQALSIWLNYKCCAEDQDILKKDILYFIKQFDQELWYPNFQKVFQEQSFESRDIIKARLISDNTQYQTAAVNEQDFLNTDLSKFEHYSPAEKQSKLKQLIQQSYMVLDDDNLPEFTSKIYGASIKKIIFNDERSTSSMLQIREEEHTRQKKFSRLRSFQPNILKCFQRFVQFCQDIKEALKTQDNFLCKLFLNFKLDLLKLYRFKSKSEQQQINLKTKLAFLNTVKTFIFSMQECIILIYNLNHIAEKEKNNTFFTVVNIYTFITSLIFSDPSFYQLVTKIYKIALSKQIQKFKKKQFCKKIQISPEYRLDAITISYIRNSRREIYEDTAISQDLQNKKKHEPYEKCCRMLQKVMKYKQPIIKMKIVYQTALQIERQINEFYRKNNLENKKKVLDAENFLEIVLFIMNQIQNELIVIDLMIIRDFIHEYYRTNKKGCYFLPFLIACQGLLDSK